MSRKLNIALLWHTFGHGNLGIDALSRSHAILIRDAAKQSGLEVHFTTLGTGQPAMPVELPADVTAGPSPRLKPLLFGRSDFLDIISKSDLVFDIGEGDSFTDLYGGKRFAFQFGTKLAVLMARRPLVLAPQTVGPFHNPIVRQLARSIARRARAVYTRDAPSIAELGSAAHHARVVTDVAFALPFMRGTRSTERARIGFNVSGLLYNRGYKGRNELGLALDYPDLVHRLIESFSRRSEVEIHLVPHVSGNGPDDDRAVSQALSHRWRHLVLAPNFANAEQAKSYLSGMDFVVASRMHAAIAAFSAGVPVMPVGYSRKFNGLFEALDYRHVVDGRNSTTQEALDRILFAFYRRDRIEEEVAHGLERAHQRLGQYRDELASLLAEVANE